MSDDLVKRLRVCAAFDPDQAEAADRIEKLEALVERLRDDNSFLIDDNDKTFLHQESRIEKLEAALREIIGALGDPKGGQHVYDMRNASYIARKALEGRR